MIEMIDEEQILAIIRMSAVTERVGGWDGFDVEKLSSNQFPSLAHELYKGLARLIMDVNTKNAELSAKVTAYEAIIENSNFKMAVSRKSVSNDK